MELSLEPPTLKVQPVARDCGLPSARMVGKKLSKEQGAPKGLWPLGLI